MRALFSKEIASHLCECDHFLRVFDAQEFLKTQMKQKSYDGFLKLMLQKVADIKTMRGQIGKIPYVDVHTLILGLQQIMRAIDTFKWDDKRLLDDPAYRDLAIEVAKLLFDYVMFVQPNIYLDNYEFVETWISYRFIDIFYSVFSVQHPQLDFYSDPVCAKGCK